MNRELGTIDIGGYRSRRGRSGRRDVEHTGDEEQINVDEVPRLDAPGVPRVRGDVAANGRAGFVVDDVYSTDPWRVRFLEVRGHAEAITAPADASDQMGASSIIRVHPTRILSIGLEPGDLDVEPHHATLRSRTVR